MRACEPTSAGTAPVPMKNEAPNAQAESEVIALEKTKLSATCRGSLLERDQCAGASHVPRDPHHDHAGHK